MSCRCGQSMAEINSDLQGLVSLAKIEFVAPLDVEIKIGPPSKPHFEKTAISILETRINCSIGWFKHSNKSHVLRSKIDVSLFCRQNFPLRSSFMRFHPLWIFASLPRLAEGRNRETPVQGTKTGARRSAVAVPAEEGSKDSSLLCSNTP